ncbi:inositol monophosphatase [Candidatus Peregrinibacteria bacterium HGW-Peregrinibacteria-1]|jgi:myo-inositol-1(or 4)-monophosphatase|nr:MAG: inositol monophosphatase [Candidatus Peregrinibacteria bacterium HGW-Peregrinibacteria-1]
MLNFAIQIAQEAGNLIKNLRAQPLEVQEKGIKDLVTNADLASEKLITNAIKEKYPNHQIIGEESSDLSNPDNLKTLSKSKYIWIIDPIDGTVNYVQGLPFYCVSIALLKTSSSKTTSNFQYFEGHVELGVVYIPELNQVFHAQKGKGAFLNNTPIQIAQKTKIQDAVATTGFIRTHRQHNYPYFMKMASESMSIRRMGSAAIDLCYTACGKLDIFWEFGLKPWDIAAGALILSEAGGIITDTNGNPLDLFGQDLLATNKDLHRSTIRLFQMIN